MHEQSPKLRGLQENPFVQSISLKSPQYLTLYGCHTVEDHYANTVNIINII